MNTYRQLDAAVWRDYLAWDRTACITAVRDRIWNYLSLASKFEGPDLLTAGTLPQWPEAEASRLGELRFQLCRETGDFLRGLPQLMRKLFGGSTRRPAMSASASTGRFSDGSSGRPQ